MSIRVQCPQCSLVAAAPDGHAGRHVRCKRCNAKFPLPHGVPTLPVAPGAVGRAPVLAESPKVIDRYEVRELLGSGSYGSVYRAYDPRLGREVALKLLRTEMTASPQTVERFLREAKAAAKLDHPHIVPVYDAGCAGDVYFIASAFIKGGTLASSIPEAGVQPRRAAELAAQLASALGYAHRQGVVHRDVKPANILLDEHGSLRLMDFGLAGWTREECTRLTQQGAVMGTPAYMAPEQASGDTAQIGPASDLYSAGVVLYEMLTGVRPFGGDNAASMMYQIIHTEATPPSQRRPGLDAALEAICLKAMARKPADRYADGEAMAAALRAWAPTAALAPGAVTTPASDGAPTAIPGWVGETANFLSVRSDETPPVSRLARPEGRLGARLAKRLGPKGMLWAGAGLVLFLAAAGAATVLSLPSPKTEVGHSEGPKTEPPSKEQGPQDEIVNSFGMKLKLIQPGSFLMGSLKGQPGATDDEHPRHMVEITRPFYLGVYLVTQAEYVQVTGLKNPSWFSTNGGGKSAVEGLDTSRFPVEQVSWDDARAFCVLLNRLDVRRPTGWKYSGPTEAEWEFACRAGTTTDYFFGAEPDKLDNYAWYAANSEGRTHEVGTRPPNPWGLYDMNGNVYQWCIDWHHKDYYSRSPQQDPQNKENGRLARVLRGGSWSGAAKWCRAAHRLALAPRDRKNFLGFRVCLHAD